MPRAEQLLERDPRLDDPVRRHTGLGHAEMEGHVGTRLGEADVGVDDLVRIRVLERDDVAVESEVVEHRAVLERGLEHRRDRVVAGVLRRAFRDRPSRS